MDQGMYNMRGACASRVVCKYLYPLIISCMTDARHAWTKDQSSTVCSCVSVMMKTFVDESSQCSFYLGLPTKPSHKTFECP